MQKLFGLLLLCGILINQPLKAQYYFYNGKYYESDVQMELGGNFGIMNALTDLGGKKGIGKKFVKDLNWKNSRPCFGLYFLAMYKYAIALRLEGSFGQVTAYDSILKDVKTTTFGRYERNLSFKSRIADFQLAVEIHPLYMKYYDEKEPPRLSPYMVAGAGFFSFDPKAKLNGNWYSLHPLRTEGQGFDEYPDRKPYTLSQFNLAAGAGIKYEVSALFNARLEFNYRFLFTDYLDDVSKNYINPGLYSQYLPGNLANVAQQLNDRRIRSNPNEILLPGDQRGSPKNNDAYFSIQLKAGFIIGRPRR